MAKKKGKKKKNPQIPKEEKPPRELSTVKETVRITGAESKNQAPTEMHYDDSDPEEKPGGQNYDEELQEIMDPWRDLASQGRKEGCKSLSEILRELDCSDDTAEETRAAHNAIKSTVTSLGFRLSRLLIEYFSIFWRYGSKELAAKAHTTANTIRHESLQGHETPSAITGRFVAVVELILQGINYPKHYNERDEDDSDFEEEYDHIVWVSKREYRILSMIFYRVLFLELLFCFPFISGATESEKKDSVSKIVEFIAEGYSGFKGEMKRLESEINVLKGEELENEKNELCNEGLTYSIGEDLQTIRNKANLGSKIIEIWKGLHKVDMFY